MKYLREEYEEFKRMNNDKVAYYLMDYIKYDGAPDPIKFVNREKTYLGFVAKEEKDHKLHNLLAKDPFNNILRELSSKLPIKRPHEFAIIKYMLKHDQINLNQAAREITKYIENVDMEM